ncbi:hypothetical protein D5086_027864 [Populus alba]|uniref:Uncharacterized protein n=1 Tax=Populus alba TaxID=43335 RepID=A0ACC4AWW6_POPAL
MGNRIPSLPFQNAIAYSPSLFNGYARHGLGSEAVMLFKNLLEQKVVPNGATFVGNFICLWLGMGFFYSMDEYYGGCDSSGYWTMTAGWQFRRLWVLGIYPVFTLHAHQKIDC